MTADPQDMGAILANSLGNEMMACTMSGQPCATEMAACMASADCMAAMPGEGEEPDMDALMGTPEGAAVMTCQMGDQECGEELAACMGDDACAPALDSIGGDDG